MWTTANRLNYKRDNLRYPSDLTGEEWAHMQQLRQVIERTERVSSTVDRD